MELFGKEAGVEGVWQQGGHTLEVVDGTFLTREDDLNRMSELLFVFKQYLTAAPAW